MPLTFPLSAAEWMDKLAVDDVVFDLDEAMEISETAGGEVMSKRLSPSLWRGRVDLTGLRYDCGAERAAMLAVLRQPGASFLVYNRRKQFPAYDPDGSRLGSAIPIINTVYAQTIRLDGFPPLYRLTAGDYIGWQYGTDPVRYALHQVTVTATANGAGSSNPGRINALDIYPFARTGAVPGIPVTVIRPVCKAIILPGEAGEATWGRVAVAPRSFAWQQTLR